MCKCATGIYVRPGLHINITSLTPHLSPAILSVYGDLQGCETVWKCFAPNQQGTSSYLAKRFAGLLSALRQTSPQNTRSSSPSTKTTPHLSSLDPTSLVITPRFFVNPTSLVFHPTSLVFRPHISRHSPYISRVFTLHLSSLLLQNPLNSMLLGHRKQHKYIK